MLTFWNTRHRALEPFRPIEDKKVGMYTCGPTVYNPVTLGNWRAFLFDDVLHRTLKFFGYDVTQVMNITDVGHLVGDADEGEDKVEREAAKRGMNALDLARSLEAEFLQGMERLNIEKPEVMPRATEHIAEQIALVQELEKKGFAYRTSDGMYFDTAKFSAYGALSGQKLEDKEAGARVAANLEKRNPTDFALWKLSEPLRARPELVEGSPKKKRQMEWDSPWGVGFPGWHIECSAMSVKYLGQPFDIHTGGVDHIAVHHENEIAQSEAASGKPLANFWLHNEFLLVDGRRMGKSEGNAFTLDDLAAKGFDPLDYRYFTLGTHYRTKLNFTWEGLEGARSALKKLRAIARGLVGAPLAGALGTGQEQGQPLQQFAAAIEDDLNTPQALAAMWEMLKSDASAEEKSASLLEMDAVFGLRLSEVIGKPSEVPAEVVALGEERQIARQNKDWKRSDELREAIKQNGWLIEDQSDGGFELNML